MARRLSLNNNNSNGYDLKEVSPSITRKSREASLDSCWEQNQLIPGLLDEISVQILARLPKIYHLNLKLVSQSWKATIMSRELYRCRKELGTTEQWLYILTKTEANQLMWNALDPISKKWQRLPPMPTILIDDGPGGCFSGHWLWKRVGSSIRIPDDTGAWLGKRGEQAEVTFSGCSFGAIDGCLYALGGFVRDIALRCVWRYNPSENAWGKVSPMSTARAYCKTGILNGKLYVVGGLNMDRGGFTPLRSAEVFDPTTGLWSDVPKMPSSKAQMLIADLLEPIATGMTSYCGKLYVPQSLYSLPYFVDVGGEVYDPEMNVWVEMPNGMGDGWPAKQAGAKLSVAVGGELFALDPSRTENTARIKVYNHQDDTWKEIGGDIPIRNNLDSLYLLSGLHGKLHVITKDVNHRIVVMHQFRQNSLPPAETVTYERFIQEYRLPIVGSGENSWKVIASRRSGSAALVCCQTLDV